jgi:hypothetical protein
MEKLILKLKYLKRLIYRYFIFRKYKNYYLNEKYQISSVSKKDDIFFGYFNKKVESTKGFIVLKIVGKGCEIVLIDKNIETFLYKCSIYNLQQGVMLHLLDDEHIIFNDLNNENFLVSKVFNLVSKKVIKTYDYPIQNTVFNSDYFFSIDYDLINEFRPEYAYGVNIKYPKNRGVFKINWRTDKVEMLFTYDYVFNFNKSQTMDNSSNWINHLESSPDGNSIVFFHRWVSDYGRFTRLICYVNQKLEILNGDIMTSHMSWIDNDKVVAFCSTSVCENKYHLFSIKNKQNVKILEKLPSTDGHPILINNKIITDTYPNKAGYSKLIKFDLISNDSELIGEFYQPFKYRLETRIDLHPKFDINNNVIIESGHFGARNLYKVEKK